MALLKLEDGTIYNQLADISRELAALNIQLNYWSVGEDAQLRHVTDNQN